MTGCNVVAVTRAEKLMLNPGPTMTLHEEDELLLIGTVEAEKQFIVHFNLA